MKMNILCESERFSPEQLEKIEAHYGAKYVCETCLLAKGGGWINSSVSIFYQTNPDKVPEGGSQWFGLFFKLTNPLDEDSPRQLCIVNAISAVGKDIAGIVADNGDVIYSRYRHDCRWSPDGSVMIDGGRDYTRTSAVPNGWVKLWIIHHNLVIVGKGAASND